MNIHSLPIGDSAPDVVNVIIEIPAGTHNKYEYDEKLDVIKLDRVLHSPFFYPVDYGFIAETHADDGDHLDVLLVNDSPTFPGCFVECRPLGLFKMSDDKGIDDKVIAVPVGNPHYKNVQKLSDLEPHLLEEISHFFEQYKKLEKKEVKVIGWSDRTVAVKAIARSHAEYKKGKV